MHTVYPVTTFDTTITYPSVDYPVPTYATGTVSDQANGYAFFTSNAMLHLPDWSTGAGRPALIACHGGAQTAYSTFAPGTGRWGDYVRALADYGFVILAMDLGQTSNGNNLVMTAMDKAFAYVTAITGGTKVGLIGSSAGALACLSYIRKRPTRVGATWLIEPFIDLDASRGTSDWTQPYTVAPGDVNGANSYPPNGPSASNSAFLCTDDAGFHTNAIDQGHTPARYPTDYAGNNIVCSHAYTDATVPYQQTQWWVAAVNSPTVQFRPVSYSGATHDPSTSLAGGSTDAQTIANGGLPRSELRDFFLAHL